MCDMPWEKCTSWVNQISDLNFLTSVRATKKM